MPRVFQPQWLAEPENAYLPCDVAGAAPPNGLAVEIRINGSRVTAIVPDYLVNQEVQPNVVMVKIIADLPDDPPSQLVELPTEPINATQRVRVKPEWFAAAP